jgi:dihydrodipicolinate synthase/N-acetylneuraminate lyase
VLPELTRAILDAAASGDAEKLNQVSTLLDELKSELAPFPIPWGLKWLAEGRGILTATFSQPVAAERSRQAQQLVAWFRKWQPGVIGSSYRLTAKR